MKCIFFCVHWILSQSLYGRNYLKFRFLLFLYLFLFYGLFILFLFLFYLFFILFISIFALIFVRFFFNQFHVWCFASSIQSNYARVNWLLRWDICSSTNRDSRADFSFCQADLFFLPATSCFSNASCFALIWVRYEDNIIINWFSSFF